MIETVRNAWKIPELRKKILFTIFALLIFRLGSAIPVPFVNGELFAAQMNAMNGTILAHTDGNVPNLVVNIPRQDAYTLGQLFYFFEFACGISGYLLGVNPFNQPGVESYKRNMFALLGKPGYEEERENLMKRL